MQAVYGAPGEEMVIGDWFAQKTGRPVHPPFTAIGWLDGGELRAAALFNDFNGSNIEIHIVADKMTRQMIREVFEYVFVRANCNRLTAKPHRKNRVVREIAERVGFVFEAALKNYYGPGKSNDAMVYRLDRETAERWLSHAEHPVTTAAA